MSMMRGSSPGSSLLGKNIFIVIAENCIDRPCIYCVSSRNKTAAPNLFHRCLRAAGGGRAAGHVEDRAGGPGRTLGGEEQDRLGHVGGRAGAPERGRLHDEI